MKRKKVQILTLICTILVVEMSRQIWFRSVLGRIVLLSVVLLVWQANIDNGNIIQYRFSIYSLLVYSSTSKCKTKNKTKLTQMLLRLRCCYTSCFLLRYACYVPLFSYIRRVLFYCSR